MDNGATPFAGSVECTTHSTGICRPQAIERFSHRNPKDRKRSVRAKLDGNEASFARAGLKKRGAISVSHEVESPLAADINPTAHDRNNRILARNNKLRAAVRGDDAPVSRGEAVWAFKHPKGFDIRS